MKHRTEEKPKPRIWHTYSKAKQDAIIAQFWRDYFDKYPDEGSITELNILRKQLQRPDYAQFRREHPTTHTMTHFHPQNVTTGLLGAANGTVAMASSGTLQQREEFR